jgi:hypothetical protein
MLLTIIINHFNIQDLPHPTKAAYELYSIKLISDRTFCLRISYQVRYNQMRLKITCPGFAPVIKEASFIFHLLLCEKLGLCFFVLFNS